MIRNDNKGSATVIVLAVLMIIIAALAIGMSDRDSRDSTSEAEQTHDNETIGSPEIDNILRNDVARAITAVHDYAADNNGRLPATNVDINIVEDHYFPDDFTHPESGLPYTINQLRADTHHYITYLTGYCDENGNIALGDRRRQFAAQIELTNGNLYCVDV